MLQEKKLTSLQKFSEIFRMQHHLDRRSSQDLLEGTRCYMICEKNIRISNWKLQYVVWLCITVPDAHILIPLSWKTWKIMIKDMTILPGTGGYAK